MKAVFYLKIEVPDELSAGIVSEMIKHLQGMGIEVTEIHIPTDEEIKEESYNVTDQAGNQLLVLDEVDVINLFSKLR